MSDYTGGRRKPGPDRNRRAILCDLDDTLFDHAHATRHALATLLARDPAASRWPLDEVEGRHNEILEVLHADVLAGRRGLDDARIERFRQLLTAFDDAATIARATEWAGVYRAAYETGWRPVAGALELLAAAADAGVQVAVVTNNHRREQALKLERCGMTPYVATLVTSEEIGTPKPAAPMFEAALDRLKVPASSAVMFGDGWATDVEGARAAGIRAVWFNRRGIPSLDAAVAEVRSLQPAKSVLERLLSQA